MRVYVIVYQLGETMDAPVASVELREYVEKGLSDGLKVVFEEQKVVEEESAGETVLRIMRYMGTTKYLKTMADLSALLYTEQCMSVLKVLWNTMEFTDRNFIVKLHYIVEDGKGITIIQIEEDSNKRTNEYYIDVVCLNEKGDMMSKLNVGKEDLDKMKVDYVELLQLEMIIHEFLYCKQECYMEINNQKLGELLTRQYSRIDAAVGK